MCPQADRACYPCQLTMELLGVKRRLESLEQANNSSAIDTELVSPARERPDHPPEAARFEDDFLCDGVEVAVRVVFLDF
jgi:hypothetical protein